MRTRTISFGTLAALFFVAILSRPAFAQTGQAQTGQAQSGQAQTGQAETIVDLELVLAVDISLSMQLDEQRLQREGYVAAFRDPALIKAIQAGPQGRIAVTYFEWAGGGIQSLVVPWRIIATPAAARAFADELAAKPTRRARMTSISGALQHARELLTANRLSGLRRVVDVSGDGPNNSGAYVEAARDVLVKNGIVINGLPIMLQSVGPWGGYFEIPNLDKYYRDCVIGGIGAFALAIRETAEFATAIRQKLLLEIAGRTPPRRPVLVPAQLVQPGPAPGSAPPGKYDCLIGEKRWDQFRRDGYSE